MRIRECRLAAGVTRNDLAAILEIDLSTISKWETGCSTPRALQLPTIAKALHCTIDELFQPAEKGGE